MATVTSVVKTQTVVTLELSGEEALTLGLILGKVGGSPTQSRRKYVDSVYNALHKAGFAPAHDDKEQQYTSGTINFKDQAGV
jgi:hypothetical protein